MRITSKVSLVLLFLFIACQLSAQKRGKRKRTRPSKEKTETTISQTKDRSDNSDFRKSKGSVEFRVHAGANVTILNSITSNFGSSETPGVGYEAGLGIVYYFSPKFKMRFGVAYKNRNFKSDFSSRVQSYNYQHLSTPALFEFQYNRLSFFAGPQINYLLKAQRSTNNSDPVEITGLIALTPGSQLGIGFDILQSDLVLRIEGFIKTEDELVAPGANLVLLF